MEPVVHLTPSCGLKGKLLPKPTSVGEVEARDVNVFLGIPYGEPPVGSLRFTDPKPAALWSGVRSATEFGAVCPQDLDVLLDYPIPVAAPELVSEDCLFLNIWTPSLNSESRLPVMFWIYGGGFLSGFSDMYDVRALPSFHNVVVVTINYRLGALGFLCVNGAPAAGNQGILDQIEALKWVQIYISNFGGDPDNVTIFGESAGSVSVSLLTISPLARGLFKRAIAESGTAFSGNIASTTSEFAYQTTYEWMTKNFADCPPSTATGSEIVEFLRAKPVDELVNAFKKHNFHPVVDGRVFPTCPVELYRRGEFNPCDLIVGCCSDEGIFLLNLFAKMGGMDLSLLNVDIARAIVTNFLKTMWNVPNAEKVLNAVADHYFQDGATKSPDELQKAVADCVGDFMFTFPTVFAASCHSRKCKTYVYEFCHRPPYAKYPAWARADHGSELLYSLRLSSEYGKNGLSFEMKADDEILARKMSTYWTNFAKTGNPNGEGLEEWPEYNEATRRHQTIQLPVTSGSNVKEHHADFWLNQLPTIIDAKP